MGKYIDADRLRAEIERRIHEISHPLKDGYEVQSIGKIEGLSELLEIIDSLQQEQPEVDLEKFTEKIKTFQGRYKYPEILSIKGAMAFMARMFYQYPNIARQWYDGLSKATMDDARKEE